MSDRDAADRTAADRLRPLPLEGTFAARASLDLFLLNLLDLAQSDFLFGKQKEISWFISSSFACIRYL